MKSLNSQSAGLKGRSRSSVVGGENRGGEKRHGQFRHRNRHESNRAAAAAAVLAMLTGARPPSVGVARDDDAAAGIDQREAEAEVAHAGSLAE